MVVCKGMWAGRCKGRRPQLTSRSREPEPWSPHDLEVPVYSLEASVQFKSKIMNFRALIFYFFKNFSALIC